MRTISTDFHNYYPTYPIDVLADKEEVLFLDIETTGLSPKSSNLYLIGCVYYENDMWHSIQWFAEKYEEELQVLTSFFTFLKKYRFLIHYNGNQFDIPYLLNKCEQYELDFNFDHCDGIDIYRRIAPYRDLLGLPDLKQKTVEEFLDCKRSDIYTGKQTIEKFHDYVCDRSENDLNDILLHNEDDLKGMLKVISMLSYCDLFNKNIRVMKAQANYFNDASKKRCQEIVMKLRFETPLPMPISFRSLGCYFSGNELDGILKVPIYEEELKYFYSNYQNYYYLPAEDIAMHKSVATFVDKAHRVQANASNCYTRKMALYLPQWEVLITPFFKRDYRSKELFFELTDEFKKSRSGFGMYAQHVLNSMFQSYE